MRFTPIIRIIAKTCNYMQIMYICKLYFLVAYVIYSLVYKSIHAFAFACFYIVLYRAVLRRKIQFTVFSSYKV